MIQGLTSGLKCRASTVVALKSATNLVSAKVAQRGFHARIFPWSSVIDCWYQTIPQVGIQVLGTNHDAGDLMTVIR